MVHVWALLNFEQRLKLELRPSESLELHVLNGTAVLDLDDFAQICRIKLLDLPEEFPRFETAARARAP